LEPEKQPSSPARSFLSPLVLLGILASYVTAIYLFRRSKQATGEHAPTRPRDNAANEANYTQSGVIAEPDAAPAQTHYSEPKCRPDQTPVAKYWLEAAAVAAALGLLITNFGQMLATQKAADAAEENLGLTRQSVQDAAQNFELDERAWVGLTGTSLQQVEANKPIEITVGIRNSGKSPAKNFHSVSWIQIAYLPRDRLSFELVDKEPAGGKGSHAVIFPSTVPFYTSAVSHGSITAPQIESVRHGRLQIFVFGTFWYDDIFGIHRWTQFCRFGDQRTVDTICAEHNDAH